MTKDRYFEATWAEFGEILGYPKGEDKDANGWHVHDLGRAMDKDVLKPLYIVGHGVCGKIEYLERVYDIMLRVYRETISAKTGNFDEIHGFNVDLMFLTHENRGKGQKLNVMDFLLNEMHQAMVERRVPPYGPYIQKLISHKWQAATRRRLEQEMTITIHQEKCLRVRKHAKPLVPGGHPHIKDPVNETEEQPRMDQEPSWLKNLTGKLEKSFCLKLDMQDRVYEAHKKEKNARRRQKEIMGALNLPVSLGSEKSITPKAQWISHYSTIGNMP
jgi:hypothetical protein